MSIKLNLGCGNKLYPAIDGWINVDICVPPNFEQTKDTATWIKSDLRNLDVFEDNYADEIHAYHVFEHFYIYDCAKVLKEWKRVLKPGGKLVLEQPDAIKCASNILTGIAQNDKFKIFNLGIQGLCGLGSEEQPYMAHKFAWYPEMLLKFLNNNGFVNGSEKPAETHMKSLRDFRVEAYKPTDGTADKQ